MTVSGVIRLTSMSDASMLFRPLDFWMPTIRPSLRALTASPYADGTSWIPYPRIVLYCMT